MIATERFVFLHLHKSGGTFVNEFLLRFVPGAQQIGYHLPYRMLPPAFAHLPALGLVRNPWSYYVSWYAFQAERLQPNPLFRVLSEGGRLDFESTVRNMLNLGTTGDCLEALIAALPAGYRNRGLNLPGFELAGIRSTGLGFYSYLYRHIYGGAGVLHIGHMEHLREELVPMLVSVGQSVSAAMRSYLLEAPAQNASGHKPYAEYYSPALRDLVAERDADIIERYGYRFGD
jgi:hypothetical protein